MSAGSSRLYSWPPSSVSPNFPAISLLPNYNRLPGLRPVIYFDASRYGFFGREWKYYVSLCRLDIQEQCHQLSSPLTLTPTSLLFYASMEAATFDDFCSFISQTHPGSGFTNYDHELLLPLNYDFPTCYEFPGPKFPNINATHLCHTRPPGSSYYQGPTSLANLPQFHAQQGQEGAAPFKSPTDSFPPEWYLEPPMAGSLSGSLSISSCTGTEPIATFERGQILFNPNLPAGSGPQPFYQKDEKCFQALISAITQGGLLSDTAPEAGTSMSNALSYLTPIGKARKIQRVKVNRFTPLGRPQASFHNPLEQQQEGVCSFNFPIAKNFVPSRPPIVGNSGSSSSISCCTTTSSDHCQLLFPPDLPTSCGPPPSWHEHPLMPIRKCSTPASNVASTAELPTHETSLPQRKKSRIQASKAKRKVHNPSDVTIIEKENLVCIVGECSVTCSTINEYRSHLRTEHDVRNSHTSGDKIDCLVSGCRKTLREGSMMRHILTHMDAFRVECTQCSASYTRIETLRSHITHRHGEIHRDKCKVSPPMPSLN